MIPRKTILVIQIIILIIVGCGRNDDQQASDAYELNASATSDPMAQGALKVEPLTVLPAGLAPRAGDPTWPAIPRSTNSYVYSQSTVSEREIGIHFGINLGVKAEVGITAHKVAFTEKQEIGFIIMSHREHDDDPDPSSKLLDLQTVVRSDGGRRVEYINYDGKKDMIIACMVTKTITREDSLGGNIELNLGSGKHREIQEIKRVAERMSGFRRPRIGETVGEALASCNEGVTVYNPDTRKDEFISGFYTEQREAIEKEIENFATSLTFNVHNAQCSSDAQCQDYFYGRPINQFEVLAKRYTNARCVVYDDGVSLCEKRGKEGANCPVLGELTADGSREYLSKGMFEFNCDRQEGFKCKVEKKASFLKIPYGFGADSYFKIQTDYAKGFCGK